MSATDQTGDEADLPIYRRRDGRPLTDFELMVYARAGLEPEEAETWAQAGIEPYQAEGFRSVGADLPTATHWTERGIRGQLYAAWKREGLDLEKQAALHVKVVEERRKEDEKAWRGSNVIKREDHPGRTVGIGEIAHLANVNPSVVSNWRRRHKDFPEPIVAGSDRRLHFDAAEIIAWLEQRPSGQGRPPKKLDDAVPESWWWIRAVEALPDKAGQEARHLVAALVVLTAAVENALPGIEVRARKRLRRLQRGKPDGFAVLVDLARDTETERARNLDGVIVPALELARPHWDLVVEMLDRLVSALRDGHEPAELLDEALNALASRQRVADSTVSPLGLAEAMVNLVVPADPRVDTTVLDPAVGEGELLTWYASVAGPEARLVGQEISAPVLAVARARLFLRGLDAEGLVQGNSLADDQLADVDADVVLVDPPIGAETNAADWLRYAFTHLKPRGRAAVLVPTDPESAGPLREPLLSRQVEGLVLLGGRKSSPLALAVLGAPPDRFDDVLVVDLTGRAGSVMMRYRTTRVEKPALAALLGPDLRELLVRYRADGSVAANVPAKVVPARQLAQRGFRSALASARRRARARDLARELSTVLDDDLDLEGVDELRQALERFD